MDAAVARLYALDDPHPVAVDDLSDVWPQVSEWIGEAIQHGQGDENLTDVLLRLAVGAYTLWWLPHRFAAVVQVVRQPRQTVCTVVYAGGSDAAALAHGFDFARRWCREHAVRVLRVWGREGWERALGLKRVGVILQQEIAS